jgi:hypothetical protein
MAFIIKFLPRTGRLNAEKCVDFGVPPGPLFGKLKAGLFFYVQFPKYEIENNLLDV